jgi:hypothetical protein
MYIYDMRVGAEGKAHVDVERIVHVEEYVRGDVRGFFLDLPICAVDWRKRLFPALSRVKVDLSIPPAESGDSESSSDDSNCTLLSCILAVGFDNICGASGMAAVLGWSPPSRVQIGLNQ